MTGSKYLKTLAKYLAGEFENKQQAIAEPTWFVNLRMWQRPVNLFSEDSLTLFAEQANVVKLEQPYRQRIMRLQSANDDTSLKVQYYMFKDQTPWCGAGLNPDLLKALTPEALTALPGCVLSVGVESIAADSYKFIAKPLPNSRCTFEYAENIIEVSLGFEATQQEFLSYDKGIDPKTQKATWGAILGPYRYTKLQQY